MTQRHSSYAVRVTEPENNLGRITPEHIRRAAVNLTRPQRRRLMADFGYYLAPAVTLALLGNIVAWGFQHHVLQLQIVGLIATAAMIIWFWAAAGRR